MTTTENIAAAHRPAHGRTGDQVELGRYTVPGAGERKLIGQRVRGTVIVIDAPAGDHGRVYLVERGLEQDGNAALLAVVADYISVATTNAAVPMATRARGPRARPA